MPGARWRVGSALGPVAVTLALAGCAQPAAFTENSGLRARAALAGVEIPDVDADGIAAGEVRRSYSQFLRGDESLPTSFSPAECEAGTRRALAIAPDAAAFQVSANTEAPRNYTVSMDDAADAVRAATAQYDAGCAEVTMQVEKGSGPIATFVYRVLPTPAALGGRCAEESPACHIRLLQTDWLALGPDVSPDPSLDPEVLFYAMEGFARVGDVNVR